MNQEIKWENDIPYIQETQMNDIQKRDMANIANSHGFGVVRDRNGDVTGYKSPGKTLRALRRACRPDGKDPEYANTILALCEGLVKSPETGLSGLQLLIEGKIELGDEVRIIDADEPLPEGFEEVAV